MSFPHLAHSLLCFLCSRFTCMLSSPLFDVHLVLPTLLPVPQDRSMWANIKRWSYPLTITSCWLCLSTTGQSYCWSSSSCRIFSLAFRSHTFFLRLSLRIVIAPVFSSPDSGDISYDFFIPCPHLDKQFIY